MILRVPDPYDPEYSAPYKELATKVIAWLIVVMVVILLTALIVWLGLFSVQEKVFAGVNYYRQPVYLEIGDERLLLDMFDSYSVRLMAAGEVKLKVTDSAGHLLAERSYYPGRGGGIAIDLWSEADQVKQCLVEANMTRFFYGDPVEPEDFTLTDYFTWASQPTAGYYYQTNGAVQNFLFPNNYAGIGLPDSINEYDQINGLYPVECKTLDDREEIEKQVIWWTNYDPGTQRRLYAQAVQDIESSPEFAD